MTTKKNPFPIWPIACIHIYPRKDEYCLHSSSAAWLMIYAAVIHSQTRRNLCKNMMQLATIIKEFYSNSGDSNEGLWHTNTIIRYSTHACPFTQSNKESKRSNRASSIGMKKKNAFIVTLQ